METNTPLKQKTTTIFFLYVLIVLQILDGFLTWYGVKNNFGGEANPIINFFISHIGLVNALLLVKAFAILMCMFIVLYIKRPEVEVTKIVTFSCLLTTGLYLGPAVINWILAIFFSI